MSNLCVDSHNAQGFKFVIAPRTICDSCGNNSGPTFPLTELTGPSYSHRNNVIPSGTEKDSKLVNIRNAESEIRQLDAEIARLQHVVASLQQRRNVLERFKNQEKSLFAPIRKLPDDLLQNLFLVCQQHLGRDGFIDVFDRNSFVRTITQICAYWRFIAYSCPQIWSRIEISSPDTTKSMDDMVGPFLEECITLSGHAQLHIKLLNPCTPSVLGPLCIQAVANSAHRWNVIRIHRGDLLDVILSCITPNVVFSCLESLSISDISHSVSLNSSPVLSYLEVESADDPSATFSLISAPSLRHFNMSYVHHPKSILVDFPWVQITDFEYTRNEFSSEELSSILECMPNLVSLKLNAGSSITSSSFIVLPLLKTLTLDGYSWGEDDMNILDAFTAPHLNTLHLEVDLNSSSILQFLKRSQCRPEDIKLSGTPLDMEWMTQHSSLCEVRELCLYRPKSIIEDLRLLTRAGSHYSKERSDSVFPQLQKLTMLYVESETTNVVQCLIDMLESRLAHIQQFENSSNAGGSICFLQSLTVVFEEVLNQDEKDTLRAFIRSELVCQSGIVMTINHGRTRRFGHSTITTDVYSEDIIRDGVEPKEENTKFSRALSNSFEDFSVR